MIFCKNAVLLVLALCSSVAAFSPSSPSAVSIAQMVQDSQRYHPRTTLSEQIDGAADEDDEDDDDGDEVEIDIDSPPEDDYIVNVGDLDGEDDEDAGVNDDGEPPSWYASQQRIDELRTTWRRHEKDTGSPEYQVAGMTERIAYLTKHLQQHPKDFSTRRGLIALVNKRRRLLNFLFKVDQERYVQIISSLGIRHRAPGRVESREIKYGRFPRQKAVKKHLISKKKK